MRSKIKPNDLIKSRILKKCASGASKTRITHQTGPTPKGISAIEKFERSNGEMDMHILAPNSL